MPKDKDTSIRGFGITMKEAEANTKELSTVAVYSDKETEEEKAEPQTESDIICHYYTGELGDCPGAMRDERHYVIKNGTMVMAHKQCHQRDQGGKKKTPNVIIR